MAIMPGVSRAQKFSGNSHKSKITKVVLHTTEGSSWPGYGGGGSAPHFTVKPGPADSDHIRQHIDTSRSAKALVNKKGGVETNNAGVIQIEFVGSCDKAYAKKHGLFFTENATDKDLAALAKVLAWIHKTHGVPLTATGLSWPTSNAAYASAPQRMSRSKWTTYKGVCGHTHVPENDHWDPGAFPVKRLLALAMAVGKPTVSGGGGSTGAAASKPSTPSGAGKLVVDGRWGRKTTQELQQRMKSFVPSLAVDGRAGANTWKALQAHAGTPQDGIISHQSHKADSLGNGIVAGKSWDHDGPGAKGSTVIKHIQKRIGVIADGVVGEKTIRALQRFLNENPGAFTTEAP